MVKIKMLRPIGGYEEGALREVSQADAKRLEARGVAKIVVSKAKADTKSTSNKSEGAAPSNKSGSK